jgi:hypothetical protein
LPEIRKQNAFIDKQAKSSALSGQRKLRTAIAASVVLERRRQMSAILD